MVPGASASAASARSSSPSRPERAPEKAVMPPTWSAVEVLDLDAGEGAVGVLGDDEEVEDA